MAERLNAMLRAAAATMVIARFPTRRWPCGPGAAMVMVPPSLMSESPEVTRVLVGVTGEGDHVASHHSPGCRRWT